MLPNAYLLAKIGADTAENEQHFARVITAARIGSLRSRRPTVDSPPVAARPSSGSSGRRPRARRDPAGAGSANIAAALGSVKLAFNFAKFFQIFSGLVLGCIKT